MDLVKEISKITAPFLVGAMLFSSPVYAQEPTNTEILEYVNKIRKNKQPRKMNRKIEGKKTVALRFFWDLNKDGHDDIIATYNINEGNKDTELFGFFKIETKPSEIFLNLKNQEIMDTTKGDIYLQRKNGIYTRGFYTSKSTSA